MTADSHVPPPEHIATLPLGEAAGTLLKRSGGSLDIELRKDGKPAYAAFAWHMFENDCLPLGRSDDLAVLLRHAAALAGAVTIEDAGAAAKALLVLDVPELPHHLTPEQESLAAAHADGDFAWLVEHARAHGVSAYDRALAACGDGLFVWMMRELDPRDGCGPGDDAVSRMETAVGEMQAAYDAVSAPTAGAKP